MFNALAQTTASDTHIVASILSEAKVAARSCNTKKLNKEKEASLIINNANAEKEIMLSKEKSDIRVLCLEWIDPYFSAGHWVPEQIEMAGFVSAIGSPGDQSRVLTVDEIMESKPDVIAVICCGYSDKENEVFAYELLNVYCKPSLPK